MSLYLPYAGIGSRETPAHILSLMQRIGAELARNGFTLRSGGADGADTAFEQGAVSVQYNGARAGTEIFLPWEGFNGRKYGIVPFKYESDDYEASEKYNEALNIAAKYHPNWNACSKGAKQMHTRNVAQVLGYDLLKKAEFVVCWTPNGKGGGGTGQALRIAKAYNIPVFDLGADTANVTNALATYCESLIHPEITDPSY